MNIWKKLKRPIFALAPMGGVTDTVFRQVVAHCGAPSVFYTEFTNVEGLMSAGEENVAKRLAFTEVERPIIAQVWGVSPENYASVTEKVVAAGFDGIDINMGCPARKVLKTGACSKMINDKVKSAEVIKAVKEAAAGLPVSVKTRIGFDVISTEEWIGFLLEQGLDEITVHGRLAKDRPGVHANWEEIGKAVMLRDRMAPDTVILGNGDVQTITQGQELCARYGLDGVMIGRAAIKNPWVFSKKQDVSKKERLDLLAFHIKTYIKTYGDGISFEPLKKFVKSYISGFDGAKELRDMLMGYSDVSAVLEFMEKM